MKKRKQNWTICPLNSRLCKVIVSMLQRTILIKETDHSSESWYLFTHVQKWKDCLSRRSHPKIRKKRSTYWVYGLQWNRRLLTRQRFDSEMPPEKCLILFERSSNIEEFATKLNFRQKNTSKVRWRSSWKIFYTPNASVRRFFQTWIVEYQSAANSLCECVTIASLTQWRCYHNLSPMRMLRLSVVTRGERKMKERTG